MSQHSSRGAAWQTTRRAVLERDQWACSYCSAPLIEGQNAEVDHVVSKATWIREGRQGRPDEPSNLVACCKPCNGRKGDRDEMPRINYYNPRWVASIPH